MKTDLREQIRLGSLAGTRYALAIPPEAMTGTTGERLGSLAGASLDFKDFREYQPGDDLRRIDWGAYARSDKLIVKLYREEVAPHLDLLIDGSRSMQLPDTPKAAALLRLAALLAEAAGNAKCSHRAWLAGDNIQPMINAGRNPRHWEPPVFDSVRTPAEAIHLPPPPRWRRRGVRVFISDLLWEDDPLHFLRPFVADAAAVHIIQLLTAEEEEPVLQGSHRLIDIESGGSREAFIDAPARRAYRAALDRHRQEWHLACRRTGATFSTVTAEDLMTDTPDLSVLERNRIVEAV